MVKRIYDLCLAAAGLIVLSPLFFVLGLLVKLGDGGPILFRQKRVGRHGRPFAIWKFRTMIVDAEKKGLGITKGGDTRITPVGRFLRKHKLDELPQLWNVFRGDMSFVGPRPEVPRYVDLYTSEQREILNLKPGVTDLATLEFRDEEELLRNAADTEKFYVEYCLPRKIELNLIYARQASVWRDTLIILQTLFPRYYHKQVPRIVQATHPQES